MKNNNDWTKLDNAAKIFPPTSNKKDPKVFRFSCELYDAVEKGILQRALNLTLRKFPLFRSVLKKGLFWYFFEDSRIIPQIKEETKPPCSPIYDSNDKGLLFEVTYYKKRINLEVFHALSDGMGSIQFLKSLVTNYVNLKYKSKSDAVNLNDYDISANQMTIDSFSKYFSKVKVKKIKSQKAFRIKDKKYPDYQIGIIECIVPLHTIKEAAKEKQRTITEYLVALIIDSIGQNMSVRDKKHPVSISIPVNLRGYFPSKTSRNFFSVINITHDFNNQGDTFEDISNNVHDFLSTNLNQETLQNRINLFASLENTLPAKLLPLFIKIPSLKIANRIAEKTVTSAFSNVGQITLPLEIQEHIKGFSVFTSTNKLQATMCTFKDDMVISFTSPFINNDIECSFLDRLNEIENIKIEINTNIGNIRKL